MGNAKWVQVVNSGANLVGNCARSILIDNEAAIM